MTTYTAAASSTWQNESKKTWFWVDLPLTANLALNDTLIFLSSNNFGLAIRDWTIVMPQVDTSGSPTVTFDIGFINQAGTDIESGLGWETGLTIGRAAAGDFKRATAAAHQTVSRGRGRRIGLKVSAAPATPAFSGRTVTVGLLLSPI